MRRFRYFICNHNLIDIAHGRMERVIYYAKKPKQCRESWCDHNEFLETIIEVDNPIRDAKNNRKPSRKKLACNRKKR